MYSGITISVSKWISFFCGAVFGFIANKLWTFESKQVPTKEIPKYIVLYTLTAFINTWVNSIVLALTSLSFFAFLCATGISTVLNFLGLKFFVFIQPRA